VDSRPDPVEILARVSERDGKQRAFDVWVDKAGKAGWDVAVESTVTDRPGTECGVVDIEGLRYRIHHGKRVRTRVAQGPPGEHAIALAVRISMGRADDVRWGWEFSHAAWAEPVVSDE
jgi:hypothetical protein